MELDKFKDVDLVLDRANDTFIAKQVVSHGDYLGRTSTVQITNGGLVGALPGAQLVLHWKNMASGLSDDSAYTLIDAENTIFRIEYPQNMLTPGTVKANILVIYQGKTTVSREFEITVANVAGQSTGVLAKAEFSALVAALSRYSAYEKKIDQFTDNSPQEVFATLDALKAKYPNGTKGAMVVSSTGKWYWWSGSEWSEGGVYQATSMSDADKNNIYSQSNDLDNLVKNSRLIGITDFGSTDNPYKTLNADSGTAAILSNYNGQNWAMYTQTDTTKKPIGAYVQLNHVLNSQLLAFDLLVDFVVRSVNIAAQFECYVIYQDAQSTTTGETPHIYFDLPAGVDHHVTNIVLASPQTLGLSGDVVKKGLVVVKPVSNYSGTFRITKFNIPKPIKADLDTQYYLDNADDFNNLIKNSKLTTLRESTPYKLLNNTSGKLSIVTTNGKRWAQVKQNTTITTTPGLYVDVYTKDNPNTHAFDLESSFMIKSQDGDMDYDLSILWMNNNSSVWESEHLSISTKKNEETYVSGNVFRRLRNSYSGDYDRLIFRIIPKKLENINFLVTDLRLSTRPNKISVNNYQELFAPEYDNLVKNSHLTSQIISESPYELIDSAGILTTSKAYDRTWSVLTSDANNTAKLRIQSKLKSDDYTQLYLMRNDVSLAVRTLNEENVISIKGRYYDKNGVLVSETLLTTQTVFKDQLAEFKGLMLPSANSMGLERSNFGFVAISVEPKKVSNQIICVTDLRVSRSYSYRLDIDKTTKQASNIARLDFIGDWTGMTKDDRVLLKYELSYKDTFYDGYTSTSWQGDSSIAWPKKNYRLRLKKDEAGESKQKIKFDPTYPELSSWNLKSNYIDWSQTRHIVCAELMSEITQSRKDVSDGLYKAHNFGQVQGFPVELYLNKTVFLGLYTLQTLKSEELFGVDDESKHIVIQGNSMVDGNTFKVDSPTVGYESTDNFELIYPEIDEVPANVPEAVTRLSTFVNSSTDSDFKNNINQYISLDSVIDWMLFVEATENFDVIGKNVMYVSYDGLFWEVVPNDFDSSFGANFDGKIERDVTEDLFFKNNNKLAIRVLKLFPNEIKKRYNDLKTSGILTSKNVSNKIDTIMSKIGQANYDKEFARYGSLPAYQIFDYQTTRKYIAKRFLQLQEKIDSI